MRKARIWILTLSCLAGLALWAAAPTQAPGLAQHRTLANGLEVFAVENHAVPLATICVTFRGGASAQDPETAGLFHLYEHMLFDGNEKYPTQAAFMAAINRMGVANWNGGTGAQYINYYISIPSDRLAEGLEFWSWAVRKPVFNADKLEREKQVVINEIRGYHNDPNHIADDGLESRVFSLYPWRKNVDGPEENIQKATVAQLEAMRAKYYIPRNMALLVGGDLDPSRVFDLAERYFGDWEGGAAPVIGEPPQGPVPPGIALVYPDDNFYKGLAQVQLRWRGPDVLRQTRDSYAADVLGSLLSSTVGRFKTELMASGLELYDPEYIDFSYGTARDGGDFGFGAYLKVPEAAGEVLDRGEALRALVLDKLAAIARDPAAFFGPDQLEKARAKLIDQKLLSQEVASHFVNGSLTFWWSVAGTDYFFGYEDNIRRVAWTDISGLITKYLTSAAPSAIEIRLRSDAYGADPRAKEREKALGYSVLGSENAFWWQR